MINIGNRFFDFRELKNNILKREKLFQAEQHPDDEHDDPDDETRHDPERIERREKFVAGKNNVAV